MTFRLDGGDSNAPLEPPSDQGTLFQQLLWQSATLQDGNHTLVMALNDFTTGSSAATLFDYITYNVSSDTPVSGSTRLLVDDCDERIQWTSSGDWTVCATQDGAMTGTASRTTVSGSSFPFNFTGKPQSSTTGQISMSFS